MVDLSVECRGKEYKNLKVIVLTTGTVVLLCFVALFLFRIRVTAWENRKELLGKLVAFLDQSNFDESAAIKKLIDSMMMIWNSDQSALVVKNQHLILMVKK